MNRRVLKAKTEEAPQPWRVISPVDFDLFMEMLLAKLPGAIRIESSGSLVYARARNGARRLVGCLDGVEWPGHSSRTYDILKREFVNLVPAVPLDGEILSAYMRDVYPEALDRVASERAAASEKSRRRW
jgi:hypothetical protein